MSDKANSTVTRREDLRLITGRGRFPSDQNLPNQLYAAFLRSDRAHAEIASINLESALASPGVVAILSGEDAIAAGYTRFPVLSKLVNAAGDAPIRPQRPVLAYRKVRFVGEPVALIIGESTAAAQDALGAIDIEYRELPVAVTIDDALTPGAPLLHEEMPGNLSFESEVGDAEAVADAFKSATHVTCIQVTSNRVIPSPMAPRAYLVAYDSAIDTYDIYTCAQGITTMRLQLSALTGVPQDKLRLHLHDVGGSFGQRSGAYPEHAALMMAAKRLNRPVKWVASRSEAFLADWHGRAITMTGELATDGDNQILGARYTFTHDMGAYLTASGSAGPLRNITVTMTGVYRIPVLHGKFKYVVTNTAPVASYRGAGRPDIAYLVERLIEKAAYELNIDRTDFRRRNFIPLDAFPYKTPTSSIYERSDFRGCLDKAIQIADWHGFEARRFTARNAGKLRGIGLAVVIEGTTPGFFPKDQVAITFDAECRLEVHIPALSAGQGYETTLPDIVAQTLGIASECVTLRQAEIEPKIEGNASGGSRALVGTGSACRVAAEKLIEHGKSLAAEDLEVEPSQVDYSLGVYRARDGESSISLEDLARKLAHRYPHPLNIVAESRFGPTFPNGCHVAEVEIDPETGVTNVVSYIAVDDCGKVLHHRIVEGQVHGGVVQGAGQVFGEQIIYERTTGQLLTGSFSDYVMPHARLIPAIRLNEHLVPSEANPFGAKGVGESGCTASIPTLTNAVHNALHPLGIGDLDMPLTPNKLWHAIQSAQRVPNAQGAM